MVAFRDVFLEALVESPERAMRRTSQGTERDSSGVVSGFLQRFDLCQI